MGLILPLRIVQGVLALVILGLSAFIANWYNMDTMTSSPSQVNFLVFVPLWSFISIAYLELVPKFAPRASHPWGAVAFELLNVLFYFAGFIALAVFLSKLLFCRGTVCAVARADTVLAAFEFALWSGTSLLMVKDVFKTGFRKPSAAGPPPQMKESAAKRMPSWDRKSDRKSIWELDQRRIYGPGFSDVNLV
ncbi:uncharacterized protein CLUP02_00691 [Colletotrichum lupini]|uniref:MARVEL domain-containing protein n=3 Tax=Colletotrichum acutatum species complex TaxID=2707335 RepID=A0A9Q8SAW6_9PEZI|nr:uncharacterized protein CLUP02_00691 [Colletotrichum lupini]XP_060307403.1 uncharacterized protein CCOS01_14163 [Colletotrichum costaricense]XP_060385665.1 uncharacterized protein CTAM01_03424 [Colletotrichum tamarilloi]KAI3552106.1 hypothetical protein CSPX01_00782 [Colletotrichum filicis]KAK1506089.1 hypothetical protein CTAM01_03424 [Colletotrichum tamarilloi]KAK1514223.1 hypothetical protein CCOS01_14163 [Colletotrichum costaricense]UQC74044.1 hypothetical protein CLUP02_00691 [Colleto